MHALGDLLELFSRFAQVASALLQLAPQARVTPPRAAYYASCILLAESAHDIPWIRLAAVIQHESQWRPQLISQTNDYGLGQHHCPSFFCNRRPGPLARAALLDSCTNIQLTAQELERKRARCRRTRGCKDYVALYNPGNPRYAHQIHRWERKFKAAARGPRPLSLARAE